LVFDLTGDVDVVRALSRLLRRSPFAAAIAVLTLAVTIGAATSTFSLVHAMLLTPPPFDHPEALVVLREVPEGDPASASRPIPYAALEQWREHAGRLADIQGFDGTNATLTGPGPAERVSITAVTPGFLRMLGVKPWLGRQFDDGDVGEARIIVSHAFWKETLASDPRAVGRSLTLNGVPHTVVGVLPDGFVFALDRSGIWRPRPRLEPGAAQANYRMIAVARRAPAVTATQLSAALERISRVERHVRVVSRPITVAISGTASRPLLLLGAAATLALLVAFINFAALITARALDRQRELAIRSALGARQLQLAAQVLIESHLLVGAGIAIGLLLSSWTTPAMQQLALQQFGNAAPPTFELSWRVIAAVSGVTWIAALIAGMWPAVTVMRSGHGELLQHGSARAPRELLWRRGLVMSQVALALVLLISLGMVGRSLLHSLAVNPGFVVENVTATGIWLPASTYPDDRSVATFYSTLQERLGARLDAKTAIVDELPLTGIKGRTAIGLQQDNATHEAVVRTASPDYFSVMAISILGGRSFSAGDNLDATPRVILSASLASTLFGPTQPIGRRVWVGATQQMAEVIGIAGDVAHQSLENPSTPAVYLSGQQSPSRSSLIVVNSTRSNADVTSIIRNTVAGMDGDVPIYRAIPMREIVEASPGVPTRRVLTTILVALSVIALVLGVAGLFGLFAYDVAIRQHDTAVRVALGANPANILSRTIQQGIVTVGVGIAAGALLSWPAVAALRASAVAPEAMGSGIPLTAAAILLVAGILAVLPPAIRAGRTDPLAVLRLR
jgi:predicted permease